MSRFTLDHIRLQSKSQVYQGFHKVYRMLLTHVLFAGGWSKPLVRELVVRQPAVAVLLYDECRDCVVLVEQLRVGALEDAHSPWQLELVAGIIDTDQTQEQVAAREVQEEAGLVLNPDALTRIYDYWVSPGGSNERLTIFYAPIDASQAEGIYGLDSEGEDIRVCTVPRQQAWQWVQSGTIANASTIIALQWLQLKFTNH